MIDNAPGVGVPEGMLAISPFAAGKPLALTVGNAVLAPWRARHASIFPTLPITSPGAATAGQSFSGATMSTSAFSRSWGPSPECSQPSRQLSNSARIAAHLVPAFPCRGEHLGFIGEFRRIVGPDPAGSEELQSLQDLQGGPHVALLDRLLQALGGLCRQPLQIAEGGAAHRAAATLQLRLEVKKHARQNADKDVSRTYAAAPSSSRVPVASGFRSRLPNCESVNIVGKESTRPQRRCQYSAIQEVLP